MAWSKHIGVGVVCALAAPLASATTLYSQTNFDPTLGWFSTSNSPLLHQGNAIQRIADNFSIDASGGAALVDTVRWYGFTRDAATTVDPNTRINSFTIEFFSDSGGVGSLLYSETFTLAATNPTTTPPPNNPTLPMQVHEVTLSNTFVASHNTTYWISIYAEVTNPSQNTWLWVNGATGSGADNTIDGQFNNSGNWDGPFSATGADTHFELLGTLSVIIPLPSVAGLSALGLLAVGGTRRRKIV